jgi:vacuolar-type H+-ATPase subunit H
LIIGDIDQKLQSVGGNLIKEAKVAFREAMDFLFDTKLIPLIQQLEAVADRVLDHAREEVNKIVDNFMKQANALIDNAVAKANEFVGQTAEVIKNKIIDAAFDRLNEFESKLFRDMTSVLNRVDEILKQVSCYAQALVTRVTEELRKVVPYFSNPSDKCRRDLNILFPGQHEWDITTASFTPNQLYEFRKCKLLNSINDQSDIKAVQMTYRDLELLSGDMRCLSVSSGAISNEKYYIKEMGEFYHVLELFQFSTYTSKSLKFLDY